MIKKLSFISVFLLCFLTVSVHAQDAPGSPPAADNALDQRVADRVEKLKTNLDTGEIKALENRCKPAQNKLNAIQKAATAYSSAQSKSLDNIIDNLNKLSGSLRNEGYDASRIEQKLNEINKLNTTIDEIYESYITAIDDSANIDCEGNPEGFRSSVDDAKQQFTRLADYRKSLKDLIKIDLKEALISLKGNI